METNTVETGGHDALLTEEGHSVVDNLKVYTILGLATVGAVVVTKKVTKLVKASIELRKSAKTK